MVEAKNIGARLTDLGIYLALTLLALICLLPVLHIVAISFSARAAITAGDVFFWPVNFTTANYERVFADRQFLRSTQISLTRVALGTVLQVFLSIITAYPLAYVRGFRGQDAFKGLLIFTMMFSGGLIPWYLVLRALGLVNNIWGLVLPYGVSAWSIILLVNFFREIPTDLTEAAELDGASHWQILWRLFVPLSMPAIALLTLNAAIFHWNSWFDGLVLMNSPERYPLQSLLQTMIVSNEVIRLMDRASLVTLLSAQGLRAAQIVVATIPIVLIYPFLQRYFVTGLKLGGIKG